MKILGLILARGGSKGIPNKNIKSFCGKPLITWTIEQAIQSEMFENVIVSTDSNDILNISLEAGAETPFLRPKELSSDFSPSIDSVIHSLDYLSSRGDHFDAVTLLEPTSPLRTASQLTEIVQKFINLSEEYDSLITIGKVRESVELLKTIDGEEMKPYSGNSHSTARRQDIEYTYFPYGVAYIAKTSALRDQKTFYTSRCSYFMLDDNQCFEIDDSGDFLINEALYAEYFIDK